MRRLVLPTALLATSCIDVYRGAIVQMNLRSVAVNEAGEHYELFAVIHGGAVSVGRFKVLDSIEQCGQDPLLSPKVKLVQAYHDGMSAADQCDPDRRLGTVDLVDTAAGSLLGGVRIDTPVDLSEAERVFVTVEVDGDAAPPPGAVVWQADVARGVDPFVARRRGCLERFCDGLSAEARAAEPTCARPPEAPRPRRGVLLGTLVRAPATACAEVAVGEVAIVPAEDDTFL